MLITFLELGSDGRSRIINTPTSALLPKLTQQKVQTPATPDSNTQDASVINSAKIRGTFLQKNAITDIQTNEK